MKICLLIKKKNIYIYIDYYMRAFMCCVYSSSKIFKSKFAWGIDRMS